MSTGTFNSNEATTPAVSASGDKGAHGLNATSDTIGVYAFSPSGTGIYASSEEGFAGRFAGNVTVVQGHVGLGIEHPSLPLHVSGQIATGVNGSVSGALTFFPPDGFAWFHIDNGPAGGRMLGRLRISYGGTPGEHEIMSLDQHGTVTIPGDIVFTNADCAEEFDVAAPAEIEPGTVMVLDQEGTLQQSQHAYDKRVAGVVSGAGTYRPGMVLDRQPAQDNRLPVALVGKVFCKVDAQYGPIEVGDLLTTSATPGHAMKADDPLRAFGAVIGKALRAFPSAQGLVPILVALQ